MRVAKGVSVLLVIAIIALGAGSWAIGFSVGNVYGYDNGTRDGWNQCRKTQGKEPLP